MLVNLLLCDDDISDLLKLQNILEKYFFKLPDSYEYHIDTCSSGEDFLKLVAENIYQIAYLDIELPGITGLEAAKQLRHKNENIILVFVSSHDCYIRNSLEVNAFRYLDKPINTATVEETCNAVMKHLEKSKPFILCVEYWKDKHLIDINNLIYIDVYKGEKKTLQFHIVDDSVIKASGTLRDYCLLLNDYHFVTPKKGLLVNLRFIKTITDNQIILKDNRLLPLSRRQAKQIQEQFTNCVLSILQ